MQPACQVSMDLHCLAHHRQVRVRASANSSTHQHPTTHYFTAIDSWQIEYQITGVWLRALWSAGSSEVMPIWTSGRVIGPEAAGSVSSTFSVSSLDIRTL